MPTVFLMGWQGSTVNDLPLVLATMGCAIFTPLLPTLPKASNDSEKAHLVLLAVLSGLIVEFLAPWR
jgi:hypothetical protein